MAIIKTIKGKKVVFAFIVVTVLLFMALQSLAEENSGGQIQCSIHVEGDTEVAASLIETEVSVYLNDETLKNDQLSLSYHIYSNEDQLYVYEGERKQLGTWVDGQESCRVPVRIDLNAYGDVPINQDVVIRFDVVDESKGFWFSTNSDIRLETDTINCYGGVIPKLKESIRKVLRNPVALLFNVASVILFVFIIIKLKQNDFELI